MAMPAGFMKNWKKAKFSGKSAQSASVNSNAKPLPAHGGMYAKPDKMAPRKSGG